MPAFGYQTEAEADMSLIVARYSYFEIGLKPSPADFT